MFLKVLQALSARNSGIVFADVASAMFLARVLLPCLLVCLCLFVVLTLFGLTAGFAPVLICLFVVMGFAPVFVCLFVVAGFAPVFVCSFVWQTSSGWLDLGLKLL